MEQTELLMASAFYESNLYQQRDCLIPEIYSTKSVFLTVISIKRRFG